MSFRERLTSYWGAKDPEQTLVKAACRGDRRAFDTLISGHRSLLRGFIARRVGMEAADDVLQECLLAAWGSLASFQGRSRFKAWLFRVALFKCADHHRARAANATEPLDEELFKNLSDGRDPYSESDLRASVQSLLSRLPEAQREVVDLYYFADLTLAEIAEALGRNLNTVKYQFYRAQAQVADALQERQPEAFTKPPIAPKGAGRS